MKGQVVIEPSPITPTKAMPFFKTKGKTHIAFMSFGEHWHVSRNKASTTNEYTEKISSLAAPRGSGIPSSPNGSDLLAPPSSRVFASSLRNPSPSRDPFSPTRSIPDLPVQFHSASPWLDPLSRRAEFGFELGSQPPPLDSLTPALLGNGGSKWSPDIPAPLNNGANQRSSSTPAPIDDSTSKRSFLGCIGEPRTCIKGRIGR